MTTPRGSYGGGYGGYNPSSSSFPDTPIYDSLVAERGTPQIAPIRVPSPYSGYDTGLSNGYSGGSNLPALPALPALPSGPSSPSYQQPQPAQGGYPGGGYQQPPAPYIPQQAPQRGGYGSNGSNGYPNGNGGGNGYPAMPPQPSPSGYEAARPVPPRPVPPRQVPGGHPEEQYPRRNLGQGGGGYYQG
ncbi:DUF6643 family protein [Streptomyces sp. NBC_01198]|uniref:DUF6643 family protein n=1 Tax=Streptomyces sp. NBC_01198 TaxID=2903769 RepID=UPI002E12988F|nr:hypothetical protein OG702_32470 [Streptomyces sp. NBC_01198]